MTWPFRRPSVRTLLLQLTKEIRDMSQIVSDNTAAETALVGKVDEFIAAVQPAVTALTTALASAQATIAQLQQQIASGEPSPADAAALAASTASAQTEVGKVQAAIDALGTKPA